MLNAVAAFSPLLLSTVAVPAMRRWSFCTGGRFIAPILRLSASGAPSADQVAGGAKVDQRQALAIQEYPPEQAGVAVGIAAHRLHARPATSGR